MLYNIAGIFFILVAVWGGVFILKNKADMFVSVFGLQKERYKVIDEKSFNNIMIVQSFAVSIWFLFIGIVFILLKNPIVISLPSLTIFINIIFSKKAKRYITMK